jgi:hypothetical protein
MRIRLEYEDGPVFSTMSHPLPGTIEEFRAMTVRINGKPFSVWRTVDPFETNRAMRGAKHGEEYMRHVDEALIAAMEKMLTKIFEDACAAVEPGTELLK